MAQGMTNAVRTESATGNVREYSLYINGAWSAGSDGAVMEDFNPATGRCSRGWRRQAGQTP
jgi:hypothetical protein